MMLLCEELLNTPSFDALEMLAARRTTDPGALQKYIEKMVDVKKNWNKYRTDTERIQNGFFLPIYAAVEL